MSDYKAFSHFGFNFEKLGKAKLTALLDDLDIQHSRLPTAHELSVKAEKYFAEQLAEENKFPKEYLEEGFEPMDYTVPQLRQVLTYHGIDYHSARPDKSELVSLVLDNIDQIREDINGKVSRHPRPATRNIDDLAQALAKFGLEVQQSNGTRGVSRSTPLVGSSATPAAGSTSSSLFRSPFRTTTRLKTMSNLDRRLLQSYIETKMANIATYIDQGDEKSLIDEIEELCADIKGKVSGK